MGNLTINKANCKITFSIRYMRVSKVTGKFNSFNAKIEAPSVDELKNGTIEIEIDVPSISTQDLARDQHLISADFFNADRFPKIFFKKTSIEKGEDDLMLLNGELTVKDVTAPITFDMIKKDTIKTTWGTEAHHFICSTVINRKQFNLTYSGLIEASGSAIIDENINVTVEFELNN